jgi:amino acid adenylation domain-containing protein
LLRVDASSIDFSSSLISHGLDSLASVELQQDIEQHFEVTIPLDRLLGGATLDEVCDSICLGGEARQRLADEAASIDAILPQEAALWFEHHIDATRATYNIAKALRIRSHVEPEALRAALQTLVNRHEGLRTAFDTADGLPLRRVSPEIDVPFEVRAVEDGEQLIGQLGYHAALPIDLARAPLFRAVLFVGPATTVLLLVIHHLVADLWSLTQLYQELGELLEHRVTGKSSIFPTVTEAWRRASDQDHAAERQRALSYWLAVMANWTPVDLPVDRRRPPSRSFCGAGFLHRNGPDSAVSMVRLARTCDASPFVVLLALFFCFLHRWTGQADLVVGSPLSLRTGNDTGDVLGYRVSPMPLRVRLGDEQTTEGCIALTRAAVAGAMANRVTGLSELVDALGITRNASRPPLFNVLFTVHHPPKGALPEISSIAIGDSNVQARLGPLIVEPVDIPTAACAFDLTLAIGLCGDRLALRWEYNTDLLDEATVRSMAQSFEVLMEAAVADPQTPVSRLPLLTTAKRRRIVYDWNSTDVARCCRQSLMDLFDERTDQYADFPAIIFEEVTVTYGELRRRVDALGARLHAIAVGRPETRVGILLDRSIEMVIAILGVLKCGGIFVSLDPEYPPDRLDFVIADSSPAVILTDRAHEHRCRGPSNILILDESGSTGPRFKPPLIDLEQGAYIIYTSGSTGRPKGVLNTHGGLLNRLQWMQSQYPLDRTDRVLHKTPINFDVSLWEVLWPLTAGACLIIARPGGHREPAYLAALIEREQVSTIHFVPSMLQIFLENGFENFGSLKRIICSGEELTGDLAMLAVSRLGAELHNLYGPTEASIDVSFWHVASPSAERPVPIGRPIDNVRLYVLDRRLDPVPPGMPGELYIGGVGLARCYWNRPGLTASSFVPDPFDRAGGARLYRTGDLARYRSDGTIEYIGRTDHQVKVQGVRIELSEIEASIRSHLGVGAAAVTVTRRSGAEKRLIAHVVRRSEEASEESLRAFLHCRLPVQMIPARFEFIAELPLTLSGKIDRRALASAKFGADPDKEWSYSSSDPIGNPLAAIWRDVLGVGELDAHKSFVQSGGNSLQAMQVVARIQSLLGQKVSVASLFEAPTFAAFERNCRALDTATKSPVPTVQRRQGVEPAPLSFEQERIWILEQLLPGNIGYNVAHAVGLTGPLDPVCLQRALDHVVARHEIFRTAFEVRNGQPFQVVRDKGTWPVRIIDLSQVQEVERGRRLHAELKSLAATQFDIGRGHAIGAVLVRIHPDRHVLAVAMHHIVTDGLSIAPLMADIDASYVAFAAGLQASTAPAAYQYSDYALWQRQGAEEMLLTRDLAYWSAKLAGVQPLELPTDRARPPIQNFDGFELRIELPQTLVFALTSLGGENGATLFMTLLAALKVLLFRYAGQSDVVVATAFANRALPQFESMMGFFVNTLLLRTDLSGDPVFTDVLSRVRQTSLDAYDHRNVPFEKLVESLHPVRDLSRSPLFQVMCVLQEFPEGARCGDLQVEPIDFDSGICRYDIRLSIETRRDRVCAAFQFASSLFEVATARRFVDHFQNLLEAAVCTPHGRVSELSFISPQETSLIARLNDNDVAFAAIRLEEMFLSQAAIQPDATALVSKDVRLTYAQLRNRAAVIRELLLQRALPRGSVVGVLMRKGWEQIVALLGILEAGGAYLPLDPDMPAARLRGLVPESGVELVLTQSALSELWPELTTISVDMLDWAVEPPTSMSPGPCSPDDLAYIIYTSGSTGRPKGVAINHRGAANTIIEINRRFSVSPGDRVLALSSLGFDLSVYDMFGTLAAGATIVLPDATQLRDPAHWVQLISDEQVTLWNSVPAFMELLLEHLRDGASDALSSLRLVLLSGDWINVRLPSRIRTHASGAQVVSLGGATEASIWSILHQVTDEDTYRRSIPYGRPLANQQMFVLDPCCRPCPIGLPGELYIGGAGLAIGYWRDERRTAESFIVHQQTGARLYRTGDIGRYLESGEIELLGRIDGQVKIDGFRIELGEIEAAILSVGRIRSAVALVCGSQSGDRRICAYYVCEPGSWVAPTELKACLHTLLPVYMVPRSVVPLKALPLTPNGKLDRAALPVDRPREPSGDGRAPRTRTERLIVNALRRALKLEVIDIDRNFFELGATSLSLVRARHVLEQDLGRNVPIVDFFSHPTAALLAAHVEMSPAEDAAQRGIRRAATRGAMFNRRRNATCDRTEADPGSARE